MSPVRSDARHETLQPTTTSRGKWRDEFLTPTEAADRLLVAPVTVRLWASKGLLPSVTTPGGHRRFRAEDVEAFAAKHQQVDGVPPARLLIIDDDAQFARFLSSLLATRAPRISVAAAHDGFSAGIQCQTLRPDVVILDLHMPAMDGFGVCAQLRDRFGKGRPRILALTAFASRENCERIIAAGAHKCIAKSASTEELLRELRVPDVLNP